MKKFLPVLLLLAIRVAAGDAPQRVGFRMLSSEVIGQRLANVENKNVKRQAVLRRLFEESGCSGDQLTEQKVKGSRLPNLICTLQGTGDATIIVGAHFDFTGSGTGIADNWSGASLLPSLFASLNTQPRKHTFVFIGFTDEEEGLIGSTFYARHLPKEQRAGIRAMVNIDTVGLSSPKVWASRADKALLRSLSYVASKMQLPLQGVNFEEVGSTDSEPFREIKVPSITIHSVTQENFLWLHSGRDNVVAMKKDDYYSTYKLLAGYLAYLDIQQPEEEAAKGRGRDGGKR